MTNSYPVNQFVEDVLALMSATGDERSLVEQVAPLAQRAAADPDLVTPDMYQADETLGFGSTLLHAEADHTLFVVVDSWLPGRGVNPHDHGTWAVVAGLEGTEQNTFWRRTDDRSVADHFELEKLDERSVESGEVVTMTTGEIHSVVNQTAHTTLSFHVYGKHLNHTGRTQYDLVNNREIPFVLDVP